MPKTSTKLVFFDVDHTLIRGNSGFYATQHLIKHGILKKRRLLQAVYYTLASLVKDQDVRKIYQIAMQDMVGKSTKEILKIGRECLEKDLLSRFFAESIKKLRSHQRRGDKVVLLTSGPHMIMANLAEHLGVDDFFAIGPEIKNNILTSDLANPLCHGEGKIHYAQKAAKKYRLSLQDAYFYTDHHSDIPLLERVGFPHCINPNFKLKTHALKMGWPILNFK